MCQEIGWGPSWAQVGPRVPQLDTVHGVLREEARDAARETQALDRSAAEGEAAAQCGVLVLYGFQPVCIVVPVDVETGHPRVWGQDIPLELREVWLQGWVLPQLRVGVLIVDIVAHADELLSVVGAGDEDHGHTYRVGLRDEGWIGGISLKDKHVSPCWDRADQYRV